MGLLKMQVGFLGSEVVGVGGPMYWSFFVLMPFYLSLSLYVVILLYGGMCFFFPSKDSFCVIVLSSCLLFSYIHEYSLHAFFSHHFSNLLFASLHVL